MRTKETEQTDVRALVKHFGGRIHLWRLLTKHGDTLSVKAIEAWMTRGIPLRRLMQLQRLAETIGKPLP